MLCFLSLGLSLCALPAPPVLSSAVLGTWPQVKTWRGMMVLPPGPTTCLLACTRSCAKERRVPNYAPPLEHVCGHFFFLLNCWLSHSLLHIYCMCGGSGRLRAGTVGLKHHNWMHPSLVRDGLDMTGHAFTSVPPRKGTGGIKKKTSLLPLSLSLPTQIHAFFFCHAYFLFFFSVFSADLCLTERVHVNSQEGRTGWDEYDNEHFYPNKHKDLKMYRCHWWTTA